MLDIRRKPGAMGPYIEDFGVRLLSLGYTRGSTRGMLKVVGGLGRWLAERGLTAAEFDESMVAAFIKYRLDAGYRQKQHRRVFILLLDFLRDQQVVPVAVVQPLGELEVFLQDYRQWLIDERDLAPTTVLRYVNLARRFLRSPQGDRTSMIALSLLSGGQVASFMLEESTRVSLGSARGRVAELRCLLRYLQLHDLVQLDLAAGVPSVAGWRDADLPVSLVPSEVEQLVASCTGSRSSDARDRAILLLLARLGLRSIEVARLQLEDLEWHAGEIVIRGKAGRNDRMPLPVDVGQALADYLQNGRPETPERHVFLTVRARRKPIPPDLVADVVRRACRRSQLPVVGAHRLRHSLATAMLAKGVSLRDISQVLRHQDLATTAVYAKVDMTSLRAVAAPWPKAAR